MPVKILCKAKICCYRLGCSIQHVYCTQASLKYCLGKSPKLVDIIAAVPEEYRAILLPQ